MKFLIASDLHGSAETCRALLARFDAEGADRLLLLGDLLYHGPRNDLPVHYDPKKVIELLNARKNVIFCVRGNCDTEVDQMVLSFPILADYALFTAGRRAVFATHGHRFNATNLPPLQKGDVLLHGHTHIPIWEEHEGILVCNPGSVTLPKGSSERGYMIWDDLGFTWKTLDGTPYHSLAL